MASVLGLDLGTSYVGIAVSDPEKKVATPRQVLKWYSRKKLLQFVTDLVVSEGIERVVIGRPVSLQGSELPMTRLADKFAALLREQKISVELVDERLSTREAQTLTLPGGRADARAAALFLQTYLDSHGGI
jgi:putative Holliday junction resolvase